jgi:aarF domain-containing kinase
VNVLIDSEEDNEDEDRSRCEAKREVKKVVARSGLVAFLKMLFLDNLAHGDLHPGNILIRPRVGNTTDNKRHPKRSSDDDSVVGNHLDVLREGQVASTSTSTSAAAGLSDDDDAGDALLLDELSKSGFELVMIDAGIVCELHDKEAGLLVELFAAIVKGNKKERKNDASSGSVI